MACLHSSRSSSESYSLSSPSSSSSADATKGVISSNPLFLLLGSSAAGIVSITSYGGKTNSAMIVGLCWTLSILSFFGLVLDNDDSFPDEYCSSSCVTDISL